MILEPDLLRGLISGSAVYLNGLLLRARLVKERAGDNSAAVGILFTVFNNYT